MGWERDLGLYGVEMAQFVTNNESNHMSNVVYRRSAFRKIWFCLGFLAYDLVDIYTVIGDVHLR